MSVVRGHPLATMTGLGLRMYSAKRDRRTSEPDTDSMV
jgi:hypothetical protein